MQAAGLKAYVTWHVTSALQAARECCGGQGFLAVNRIGVLKSDSDVYTTFEGDNTVLMQLVAKGLLTEYRQQFGSMRLGGVIRFLASRASRRLVASNPVAARNTDEGHLRDPEAQAFLLRYREERLLEFGGGQASSSCLTMARTRSRPSPSARIISCRWHMRTSSD